MGSIDEGHAVGPLARGHPGLPDARAVASRAASGPPAWLPARRGAHKPSSGCSGGSSSRRRRSLRAPGALRRDPRRPRSRSRRPSPSLGRDAVDRRADSDVLGKLAGELTGLRSRRRVPLRPTNVKGRRPRPRPSRRPNAPATFFPKIGQLKMLRGPAASGAKSPLIAGLSGRFDKLKDLIAKVLSALPGVAEKLPRRRLPT